MTISKASTFPRLIVHLLVVVSGLATLSWEVIWQIKSTLALGISAWGTAITLAVTMGGMSIGSICISRALKGKLLIHPVRIYGLLEVIIGTAGLLLSAGFVGAEKLDVWVYAQRPDDAWLAHLICIIVILGIPAICMGATLPVFGLVARQYRTSIALLYSLNTLGAAIGVLVAAFILIPLFGITHTIWLIAAFNMVVGILTWMLSSGEPVVVESPHVTMSPTFNPLTEQWIVFVTGFATFALEIAWFRALTAAFFSTTDAFAIMLSALLLSLGAAAILLPYFREGTPLGSRLSWSGILILCVTPVIERFGYYSGNKDPTMLILGWFVLTLYAIGPPMFLLGMAFPWIIDEQNSTRRWGFLYSLNTLAAIIGALGAAWVLLPAMGFARTSWLVGALVTVTGVLISPRQRKLAWSACGIAALLVAVTFESGIGRTHVIGKYPGKIIESYEGPEANVSAVVTEGNQRMLVIDGFVAASQLGGYKGQLLDGYMAWMGHLPMLLHPDPKNALVICFGTGQTANAVRQENPVSLDIVDINPRVIKLAHNFSANQGVLDDPRVKVTIMDGRAYMQRTTKQYDVITLEPMPPNFAGVNALYSREFYELARKRLTAHGVLAQWLPFHLVGAHYGASIARTFMDVFPNAVLWRDVSSGTGILIGSADDDLSFGTRWPGFGRTKAALKLTPSDIKAALMDMEWLQLFSATGEIITDDNQLLSYGKAVRFIYLKPQQRFQANIDLSTTPETSYK